MEKISVQTLVGAGPRACLNQLVNQHDQTIDLQDGIYHSQILPDFQLTEAWLWQDPLPNVLDILKHLNVI